LITAQEFDKIDLRSDFDASIASRKLSEDGFHSIACGDDRIMTSEKTQATDARDMVKELKKDINIGCNTEALLTSEKNVGVCTETNEIGSQANAHSKDVMCNTNKTNTES
jgi:hypothetical protein